jgi:hypothetical protein
MPQIEKPHINWEKKWSERERKSDFGEYHSNGVTLPDDPRLTQVRNALPHELRALLDEYIKSLLRRNKPIK